MYKKLSQKVIILRAFISTSQQAYVLVLEMFYGIFFTLTSVFIFLKIREEVFQAEIHEFDQQIVHFLYTLRSPLLNTVMIVVSYFGAEIAVLMTVLLSIVLMLRKHKREAFLMCFVLIMSLAITNVLKILMQRPRPQYFPLVTENTFSFPSGHSMTAFVVYTTFAYFTYHFTRRKKLSLCISVLCFLLISLIGFSRVYLGVHYPSDVLAGYFGGLAWFSTVLLINKTLIFFKLFRDRDRTTGIPNI